MCHDLGELAGLESGRQKGAIPSENLAASRPKSARIETVFCSKQMSKTSDNGTKNVENMNKISHWKR